MNKVKVCVRCRPLQSREVPGKSITLGKEKVFVRVNDSKEFSFDNVYNESSSQETLFENSIKGLVEGCFEGFNATIFAYGQSGAGKTYTMGSSPETLNSGKSDLEGIIPRAVKHLFAHFNSKYRYNESIDVRSSHREIISSLHLRISFFEIYNEECKDLLHPEIPSKDIVIREDRDGKIFVTGAREEEANSVQDVLKYLQRGCVNRTTGGTDLNQVSSRSHAIFSISLEMITSVSDRDNGSDNKNVTAVGGTKIVSSKLNLVDLAGSERNKRTNATGVRLKESVGINQGLMTLGKVIRALSMVSSGSPAVNLSSTHVPYRESKLTRYLQDSLGGNSRTLMIACISPAEVDIVETLSTLKYAAIAQVITNKVVANVVNVETLTREIAPRDQAIYETNVTLEEHSQIISKLTEQIASLQRDCREKDMAIEQLQLKPPVQAWANDINSSVRRSEQWIQPKSSNALNGSEKFENLINLLEEHSYKQFRQCLKGLEKSLHASSTIYNETEDVAEAYKSLLSNMAQIVPQFQVIKRNFRNSLFDIREEYKIMTENSFEHRVEPSDLNGTQTCDLSASQIFQFNVQDMEVLRLREELELCRADLKRDEEIFQEKANLMRNLKRQNNSLESEIQSLQMQIKRLEDQEEAPPPPRIKDSDTKVPEFQSKLRDLELNIKSKEELISTLSKKTSETEESNLRHEIKAKNYENEIKELKNHLRSLKSNLEQMNAVNSDLESERKKKDEFEKLYLSTVEQLESVKIVRRKKEQQLRELESKRLSDLKSTEGLTEELGKLKADHKKLQGLLEAEEQRQRKNIDALQHEVNVLKKNHSEDVNVIKKLEKQNEQLTSRLKRVASSPNSVVSVKGEPSATKSGKIEEHPMPTPKLDFVAPPTSGAAEELATPYSVSSGGSYVNLQKKRTPGAKKANEGASEQYADDVTLHSYFTLQSNNSGASGVAYSEKSDPNVRVDVDKARVEDSKKVVNYIPPSTSDVPIYILCMNNIVHMLDQCLMKNALKKIAAEKKELSLEKQSIYNQLQAFKELQMNGDIALAKQQKDIQDKITDLQRKPRTTSSAKQIERYQEHLVEIQRRRSLFSQGSAGQLGFLSHAQQSRFLELQEELEGLNTEIELLLVKQTELQMKFKNVKPEKGGVSAVQTVFVPSGIRNFLSDYKIGTRHISQKEESDEKDIEFVLKAILSKITASAADPAGVATPGGMNSIASNATCFICYNSLLKQVIYSLLKSLAECVQAEETISELKTRVDTFESQREVEQQNMMQLRNECNERIDSNNRTYENRIGYLLSQLRALEDSSKGAKGIEKSRETQAKAHPVIPQRLSNFNQPASAPQYEPSPSSENNNIHRFDSEKHRSALSRSEDDDMVLCLDDSLM